MKEYQQIFDNIIATAKETVESKFKEVELVINMDLNADTPLEDILKQRVVVNSAKSLNQSVTITFDINTIQDIITSKFDRDIEILKAEENNREVNMRDTLARIEEAEREKVSKQNAEAEEQFKRDQQVYVDLDLKKQQLAEYSSTIISELRDYAIAVSTIPINNETFTLEELSTLYPEFISFMEKNESKHFDIIGKFNELLDNKKDNITIAYVVILIALFTPLQFLLTFGFLGVIIYKILTSGTYVKKLSIAAGLAFNVSPLEMSNVPPPHMIDPDSIDVEEIDGISEIIERFNDNEDIESEKLEKIEAEKAAAIASFLSDRPLLEEQLNDFLMEVDTKKEYYEDALNEYLEYLDKIEQEIRSKIKGLGEEFRLSTVLNTNFKFGFNKVTGDFEYIDVGLQNVVIRPNEDLGLMERFIKVLIANYLCNVRPNFATIRICDPNNQGRLYSGFYSTDMPEAFLIDSRPLSDILEDLTKKAQDNIKKFRGRTIQSYNELMESEDRLSQSFEVLVVLSQTKEVEEDEALRAFMEYSAEVGIIVIIVTNSDFKNTHVFNKPFPLQNSDPIEIDVFDFPTKVMENMYDIFKDLRPKPLMWEDFQKNVYPDETMFTGNSDTYIDFVYGYQDGDRGKHPLYTLGNKGDVHGIIVGTTGSGKSILINHLIVNICRLYDPRDIDLWLVDFKGAEFAFYLKKPHLGITEVLPHIKACLCTSDPSYSVSLFQQYLTEMEERFNMFKREGFKDLEDYNKTMRKRGTPEKCLPRSVMIVDEFQVIFTKVDGKEAQILAVTFQNIAKVARAAGYHIIFASQSMAGTISGDTLNMFHLRVALRCEKDVSMSVMKTPYAGDIREANGFLYVSSQRDKAIELQALHKTPWIRPEIIREQIHLICEKAAGLGIKEREMIYYDEGDVWPIETLDELNEKALQLYGEEAIKYLLFFGERMVYSAKGSHSNFSLDRSDKQHIISAFANDKDYVNFFKTMIKNLQLKNSETQIIYNSQDNDKSYICEIDRLVDEDNAVFNSEGMTPDTLLPIMQGIAKQRETVEDKDSLTPLYVFLLSWDKAMKFGVASDYKLTEQWTILLQTCGKLNMHFIFINTGLADIPRTIVNACNHRFAGKVDEKSSLALVDSDKAAKPYSQKDGYMFYFRLGELEKLKIYQSVLERQIREGSLAL